METAIRIEGMHCGGCADRIRRVLEREPGVREAEVSLRRGVALLVPDDTDAADPIRYPAGVGVRGVERP